MTGEEYLAEVARLIRLSFVSTDPSGSMPAAAIGQLVKRGIAVDAAAYGFARFKHVLAELESQGLIRTGFNSKNAFAVWLNDANMTPAPQGESIASKPPVPLNRVRQLRSPVWFAFISTSPRGRRFMRRSTGEVRVGIEQPPENEGEWAEIQPIDPAEELAESRRFLDVHQLGDNPTLTNALSGERWYSEIPRALAEISPSLASEWKRQRSRRVVEIAQKWCADNSIDQSLAFESEASSISIGIGRQSADLRQILMSAISQMPTEKLLEIAIPPRLLIAAIRPDLLANVN